MSIETKCRQLAEEIIDGLPINSRRIREEEIAGLTWDLKTDVEMAIESAGCRIEDYEEGRRAGVVTPVKPESLWRRVLAW